MTRKAEARQQQRDFADDEVLQDSLNQLIEIRLQIQEADREKIIVEDVEVTEEFNERIKRYGMKNEEEFDKVVRAQGITVESIKKRLRESLKVQKLVRRKVTLRVSVTDAEITQYIEENRAKLETGLSYHARHILIIPEGGHRHRLGGGPDQGRHAPDADRPGRGLRRDGQAALA